MPPALEEVGSPLPPPGWPIELLDALPAEAAESPDAGPPPFEPRWLPGEPAIAPDEPNVLPVGAPVKPCKSLDELP